jgi:hypothetical protein
MVSTLLDLPDAAAEHRNLVPVRSDAVDLELWRPDHEVDMRPATVDTTAIVIADRVREAVAEGDVACRVLVEKRVVENGLERPDASLVVDKRELAYP